MLGQDYFEEFKKLQKYRMISSITIVTSGLLAIDYIYNKSLHSFVVLILLLCISVFTHFQYRCPACNKRLTNNPKITYCYHCGSQLKPQQPLNY